MSALFGYVWFPIFLLAGQVAVLIWFVDVATSARERRFRFGVVDFYVYLIAMTPTYAIATTAAHWPAEIPITWRVSLPLGAALCQTAGGCIACINDRNVPVSRTAHLLCLFLFTLFGLCLSLAGIIVAFGLLLFYINPFLSSLLVMYLLVWRLWRRQREW